MLMTFISIMLLHAGG